MESLRKLFREAAKVNGKLVGYCLVAVPFFVHKAVLIAKYEVLPNKGVNGVMAFTIALGFEWFVIQSIRRGKIKVARIYQVFQFLAGMAYFNSLWPSIASPSPDTITTALVHLIITLLLIWAMISTAEWYVNDLDVKIHEFTDPISGTTYENWEKFRSGMNSKYGKAKKLQESITKHYSGPQIDKIKNGKAF